MHRQHQLDGGAAPTVKQSVARNLPFKLGAVVRVHPLTLCASPAFRPKDTGGSTGPATLGACRLCFLVDVA